MPPPPRHFHTLNSPVGPLRLLANPTHLLRLDFARGHRLGSLPPETTAHDNPMQHPVLGAVTQQLADYFARRRTTFNLPLSPQGTDFQRRVWDQLQRIPFGTTRTYGQVAADLGQARSSRAVGLANGRNPLPIIIPCHRVIGADGSLTGFGGGLTRKQQLLEVESPLLFSSP